MQNMEELKKVDDDKIREVLKEVEPDTLALALSASSTELKTRVFKVISKPAADTLRMKIERIDPASFSADIVESKQQIVEIAESKQEKTDVAEKVP